MAKGEKSEATQAPGNADQQATATQAGLQKALYDEVTKGLKCAARSLGALDEQERLTLLAEAEIAYQTPPTSSNEQAHSQNQPSHKNSTNSEPSSNDTLQEGN